MKNARDLSHEQLVRIVDHVQQVLYLDADAHGMVWNPDKGWDSEAIEYIAESVIDAGLKPEHEMPREQPDAAGLQPVNPDITIPPTVEEARVRQFFDHKVREWMNDGVDEVVRVLTLWTTREGTSAKPRIELGEYLEEYLGQQDNL